MRSGASSGRRDHAQFQERIRNVSLVASDLSVYTIQAAHAVSLKTGGVDQ